MNIIAGRISAGDELRPEAGLEQLVVVLGERAHRPGPRWPNTLTSACPVYASSIWPFSSPSCVHCRTNCGWARLPIRATTSTESGTVTSAISASSGEIQNMHGQHADDGEQRDHDLAHRLLQRLRQVVDVVGDPAEHLAVRLAVEVAQRQPGQLGLDLARAAGTRRAARSSWSAGPAGCRRPRPGVEHQHEISRCATRLKSTPWPGSRCSEPTRSASVPLPWWRSCATACALVSPAGSACPIRPAKIRLVASPRIPGPSTVRVTLATPSMRASATSGRCGASVRSSRRLEPRKFIAFSVDRPPMKAAGPRFMPGAGPGRGAGPRARPRRRPARAVPGGPARAVLGRGASVACRAAAVAVAAWPPCWGPVMPPPPAR